MTDQDDDPYGSANDTTSYKGQGHRGTRAGKARSALAVGVAAIFLIGLGIWIIVGAQNVASLAPAAPAGDVTGSAPTSNRP